MRAVSFISNPSTFLIISLIGERIAANFVFAETFYCKKKGKQGTRRRRRLFPGAQGDPKALFFIIIMQGR